MRTVASAFDPSSVMRYPGCGGNNNTAFNLSPLDGEGVCQLYGMPVAWYAAVLL
jgi:hypothetical protein